MSSSSLVQFEYYLCNQVGDIAGNEVSPIKQARGENGKEQNSVTEWRKRPRKKPGSVRGPVPLLPDEPVVCSNYSKVRL